MKITANELKTRGIGMLNEIFKQDDDLEAFVTVHGQTQYVILPVTKYKYYREQELLYAAKQVHEDIAHGRYKIQTAKEHIKELKDALRNS